MKTRTVVWKAVEYEGLEHITLRAEVGHLHDVSGVVIGIDARGAFQLSYFLTVDENYCVQHIVLVGGNDKHISLISDGTGNWGHPTDRQPAYHPRPEFNGCIDVDISATPFTNTLPIRRISWQVGQSEDLKMLYISAPDLTLSVSRQRYTCLEKSAEGGLFRFELIEDDGSVSFEALLPVDSDGLVLDYPGLFKRLWSDTWDV